jgi:hypothetical protein
MAAPCGFSIWAEKLYDGQEIPGLHLSFSFCYNPREQIPL